MTSLLFKKCSPAWTDYGLLALRIAMGAIFIMHGYAKITGFGVAGVSKMLGGIGFPAPELFAYLLMYGEVATGIAIILGALTYWASLFQLVVAIVAGVFVHFPKGFSVGDGGYEFVMLLGAAAFLLLTSGPGKYSVDAKMQATDTGGAM